MKRKKLIIEIVGGILIVTGLGLLGIMKDIPTLKALNINPVNISALPDGIYTGKYEFSRWKSEVSVSIQGGKLINIERLSEPLTPDVSEELFNTIIEEQKIDIDVITGATATSKAYMKSIENALKHQAS